MVKRSKKDDFIADSDSEEAAAAYTDDDDAASGSGEDRKPKLKKTTKAKAPASKDSKAKQKDVKPAAKKAKLENDEDESDSKPRGSSSNAKLKKNEEGSYYADLDQYKRVTVRQFKDKTYIDIREYYTDKNSELKKPGKKGISLTVEAWQSLKEVMSAVDAEAERLESK